jgi:hypothetical protein
MEMIQKETFKQWHNELNKPDSQQNNSLIIKLVAELRANNQQLTSLGMVTPIIATIKNIIDDKEKLGDVSRYINHSNPIRYKVSREKDTYDTTIGSEDNNFNESITDRSTESDDPNRKF